MFRRTTICGLILLSLASGSLFGQNTKENADFKLAVNLFADSLYDLASEQFKQFISSYPLTPQGVEARFYLGLTQLKLRQFDDARLTFQTFALTYQDNPRAPEAWWNVGEAFAALKNPRESALAFERVKVFHPKSKLAAESLVRSGTAFLAAGARDDARRVLRIVLQEYPTSRAALSARTSLAKIYFDEGNLEQAQGELRRVIESDPSPDARAQALLLLGNVRQASGKTDLAQSNYQEILTSFGATSAAKGARFHLGRLLVSSGRLKEGTDLLRKAAAQDQSDTLMLRDALVELGDALTTLGDVPGALAAYDRYLLLAGPPSDPALLWRISRAAAIGKNYRRSNEAATKLLQSDGPDSLKRRAAVRLALNAEAQGEARKGVDLLVQFAERYPADPYTPAVLLRAARRAQEGLRDPRMAIALNEQLIDRHETSPLVDDALMAAAGAYESLKEFDRAETRYRTLLERFPSSPLADNARTRLRAVEMFEVKNKDSGLEKLALLVGDVVAQKDRAGLAYRLGEIYYSDLKNYQAASAQFATALDLGLPASQSREARFLRSKSLDAIATREPSKAGDAVAAYQEFLSADFLLDEETAEAAYALFLLQSNSLGAGLNSATEIDKRAFGFLERADVRLRLAELYEKADSVASALRWYASVRESAPGSPAATEAVSKEFLLLVRTGESDSALALGTAILGEHPRTTRAPKVAAAVGAIALRRGMHEIAIEAYRSILTDYNYTPQADSARRWLADALVAGGEYAEALQLYQEEYAITRENPLVDRTEDVGLLLAIGKTEYLAGKVDQSRQTLSRLLMTERTGQMAAEAYTTLGMIARNGGALEEATGYFRLASTNSPNAAPNPDVADLLFDNGDYADAIIQYEKLASAAASDSARRIYESRIVRARFKQGDLPGGEKGAKAFAGKYPKARDDLAAFEIERGNVHFSKERFAQALPIFQHVAKEYDDTPSAPEALYRVGLTLQSMEKPQEAMEVLARLVEQYPEAPVLPRAHLALGNVATTLEKWDEAVRQYRRIVDDPAPDQTLLPVAMSNLIATYKLAGVNDAALALTRKYLELYPNREDQLDKKITIGILYERLGYYDQAILHLQSLLDEAGSDLEGELRYYIAEANFNKGNYQQAILDFLKVPYLVTKKGKIDWTANSLYMSGQAYEKMGRYDQALTMYRQIVDRTGIDEMFKAAARKEIDRVNLVLKKGSK